MKRRGWLIALGAMLGGIVFWRFGRTLWVPLWSRLRGRRTVAGVVDEFGTEARRRFGAWPESVDGLAILAFKDERRLEVWGKRWASWSLLKRYPFTASSGKLGPKLREGDGQVPEGIYEVEALNPNSSFHLSIRVNYPNAFDLEKAAAEGRGSPGSDIYIHGKDATIGCIPLGDDAIEELFILLAEHGWQGTPIIISPRDVRSGASFPEIDTVEWEQELYTSINEALRPFRKS